MTARLKDKEIGKMVSLLEKKTLYETGMDFELDKHYASSSSVKAAVYQYFLKVRQDPKRYGLSQEKIDNIVSILTSRAIEPNRHKKLREKVEEEEGRPFAELVLSGRQKAMKLLHRKLDRISASKKRLDETNLSTLTNAASALFDKGQIISGEATENVAVLAKVKSDMAPEEAIETVLRMREAFQVEKDRTSKKK